jgi:hypothetical protein
MRDAVSKLAAQQPSGVLRGYLRGQVRGLELAMKALHGAREVSAELREIENMREAAAKGAARLAAGRQRGNLRGRARGLDRPGHAADGF